MSLSNHRGNQSESPDNGVLTAMIKVLMSVLLASASAIPALAFAAVAPDGNQGARATVEQPSAQDRDGHGGGRGHRDDNGGGGWQAPQSQPQQQPQQGGGWGDRGGNNGGGERGRGGRDQAPQAAPVYQPQAQSQPQPRQQPRADGGWQGRGGGLNTSTPPVYEGGQARRDRRDDHRDSGGGQWGGGQRDGGQWGDHGGGRQQGGQAQGPRPQGGDWNRGQGSRDWNRGGGRDHDNDGYGGGSRWGQRDNHRDWDRGWRQDRRYDWQYYRNANRNLYRQSRYYDPYGYNSYYRRFSIGIFLDDIFFSERYWLDDPYSYRLPPVYGPYRWVRYYDDVVLVDLRNGRVVDVIYDFFW
jgi:Nickel/cobalt transporter regulator